MIDLSFAKLLLVGVIGLIVLGPERLHRVARTLGVMLRRARAGWDSVRGEVERELQVEDLRRTARAAAAYADAARHKAEAMARTAEGSVQACVALATAPATVVTPPAASVALAPSTSADHRG